MKEKIKICVEKIANKTKKCSLFKRRNTFLAFTVCFTILAELILTGMTFDGHEITIHVDGETIKRHTHAQTVAELILEEGIILGEYDEISLPLDSEIESDSELTIKRVEYIDRSLSEAISYSVKTEKSPLHKIGTEFVSVEGKNGCKVTTYREKIVDGVVIESAVASTTVYEPIDEVITVGTAHNEPYSKRHGDYELENGVPTEYAYMVSGKVTAYTAPPGSGTYSGRKLEIGTVAVNPNIIPFGSELYICSKDGKRVYGYAIAADTGDLTEVVADVFMGLTSEHYADACAWGAQDAYVYVLTVGDNSVSWM